MKNYWPKIKRIITDIAGVLLIVSAIFLGWLPGIGGIPLFLAGLGLLAINNEWAKRWLEYAKHHGSKLMDIIFANNPRLMILNDILVFVLVGSSTLLLIKNGSYVIRMVAFFLMACGLALFFGNRKRLQKILGLFKKP